ncbi:MAG: Undecaprenyl-phosphate 4-deoxy-4-formamido-L-arabinose transferase [Bacteroidota bacterium]
MEKLNLSIVVPLFNEAESLQELCSWIKRVADSEQLRYEIILIDDGSTDNSWNVILDLKNQFPIKAVRFSVNQGKSAALHIGFQKAQGDVVITMDADLQDSPDEIPALYQMITREGFDLVSGYKKKRHDPISKTIPTKLYNWATRKMSGIHLNDFNCGLKAYRNKVVKRIEVYGEMHRYIPILAHRAGFKKIGEKVVQHYPRKHGVSKFGWERFINGFLDLQSIVFISRFGKKPMHFFGTLGSLVFMIGLLSFLWLGGNKMYCIINNIVEKNIADQSVFYLALTSMIIGTQLFLAGFIGELIARNAPHRNEYSIEEEL